MNPISRIHNLPLTEDGTPQDPEMLAFAMKKMARFQNVDEIDVYCDTRIPADAPPYQHPGWLEWGMKIKFASGGQMRLGLIQRHIGADLESHS